MKALLIAASLFAFNAHACTVTEWYYDTTSNGNILVKGVVKGCKSLQTINFVLKNDKGETIAIDSGIVQGATFSTLQVRPLRAPRGQELSMSYTAGAAPH